MSLVIPDEEQQKVVRAALNEDVNTRQRDLEAIKEWLRKEPHLPDTWDDVALMNFLRGCNFSLERTKRKIDMYFTMRAAIPEFFTNRDVTRPELQEIIKLMRASVMPGLTADCKRVTVAGASAVDFDTPDIANFMKIALMLGDLRLRMEKVGVAGDVYVLDASVAILKHFVKVSPAIVKKFFVCVQEAYPVKVKEVHVINATPLVDFIIKWVSPFLKEKIRKRIHVHPDLESLFRFVPRELLPEEFGGTAGKVNEHMEKWIEASKREKAWFEKEEGVKADESKRPGKPTCHEELFGLEGSFKQLAID
ncbi:alpha-tocopherol transfer protein-like [Tribolium madens]|uniref:alpha-tocopherol transfer protein-like n=1 Tax=Tribolium madens TaxID=41895 RepID=UPI001CF72274|nr:alpha-tocopherol transfer protein-like [Tribolium madens]